MKRFYLVIGVISVVLLTLQQGYLLYYPIKTIQNLQGESRIYHNDQHIQNQKLSKSSTQLNIQTSCKNININQYDGIVKSGLLNIGITNSTSALGFIFYGAEGVKEHELYLKPTIIWLNGGPGCSSQYGNFFEIGPLNLNMDVDQFRDYRNLPFLSLDDEQLFAFTKNQHSWTSQYNVLFVDQPIGTGISFAEKDEDIPINQDQLAAQFYFALNELYTSEQGCFRIIGMLGKDNQTPSPLFIFGESYAGKYIPSIAQKIIQEGNKYNLKSIGIGDAFIAPEIILQTIPDYAYANNLINSTQLKQSWQAAQDVLNIMKDPTREKEARSFFWRFLQITNPNDVDVYNISRQKGELNDGIILETFLNAENNGIRSLYKLEMLPNSQKQYTRCDKRVQKAMSYDFMRGDCMARLEYLLNQGIDVVVYNGDLDLLVPYTAPPLWIQNLSKWPFTEQFMQAQTIEWKIGKSSVGKIKNFKNLSFYIINNSGHMVPEDQPEVSLNLINQTIERALNTQKNTDFK